eukprot:Skav230533  [mRNA]  locus=scaffold1183:211476:216167:+ [translate_table: standard]
MKGSRELTVGVGDIRLPIATQMSTTQSQHCTGSQYSAILGANPDHLIGRRPHEDLLLLVRFGHGFPQAPPDRRIGKPWLIAANLHATQSHHAHVQIRGRRRWCGWRSTWWSRLLTHRRLYRCGGWH